MGKRTIGWASIAIALTVGTVACGGGGGSDAASNPCILSDAEMGAAIGNVRIDRSGEAKGGEDPKCVYDGEYVISGKDTGRTAHAEVFVSTDTSRSADFMKSLRKNGESLDGVGDEAAVDFLNASTQALMRLDDTYILVTFRAESVSDSKLTTKHILQAIAKKLA